MLTPAGKRDRLVVIEKNTPVQNSRGEAQDNWGTFVAGWWAQRLDVGGSERQASNQQYATGTVLWKGLYVSGILASMRINDGGTYYDIQHPREIGRRQEMELITTLRGA